MQALMSRFLEFKALFYYILLLPSTFSAVRIQSSSQHCLFKFGIIADIQYIDAPDGRNFEGTKVRRYRQSLQIFKTAVKSWTKHKKDLKFSVLLGDMLDGQTQSTNTQVKCLKDIKDIIHQAPFPMHYCFGNHDFYAFNRSSILKQFIPNSIQYASSTVGGPCTTEKLYYDFSPHPGYRCIVMDSYDVSLIGASSVETMALANELIKLNNPNDVSRNGQWFNNLPFEKYRWVPYNGGVSKLQLNWLENILSYSKKQSEKVFIFCHQPIYAPDKPQSLIWNAEEILQLLHSSGNVHMWMAGHDHEGQYSIDRHGIHHVVPPAPLECAVGQEAYGHIEVFDDCLDLRWTGKIPPAPLMPWPKKLLLKR